MSQPVTETPRVGQPLAELEPGPGLTGEVAVGVLPVRAPAGVKEHRVAGLDVDVGHVVEPDDVARPAATDVDEPAARDDLGHRLDAQPRHPRGRGVGQREAVVAGVTHPQVAEGVEVRAELHRRADDLLAPVHAVLARAPAPGWARASGGSGARGRPGCPRAAPGRGRRAGPRARAPSPPPAWRRRCGAGRRAPQRRSFRRPWLTEARVQGQAAVDEDRLPGDVRGVVAGQEARHPAHLVGRAGTAHRDVTLDLLLLDRVVDPGRVDRGDGRARADAVDADPAVGVLEGQRAGQVHHPALRARVAQVVGLRDGLVDARDVDDHAAPVLGQELLDRLAGAQERAAQVDGDDLVELRAGELVRRPRDLDAGVVDEHVDATELLGRHPRPCARRRPRRRRRPGRARRGRPPGARGERRRGPAPRCPVPRPGSSGS